MATCDVLISCQHGDYTTEIYSPLRDPVNESVIRDGLVRGLRIRAGGNCTISLMLMAIGGLLKAGLVEWITAMTYKGAREQEQPRSWNW